MQTGRIAMTTSVKQMIEAANASVPRLTPAQAREMIAKGDVLLVDVRDAPEVEKTGKIAVRRPRLARHAGVPRRPGEPIPRQELRQGPNDPTSSVPPAVAPR